MEDESEKSGSRVFHKYDLMMKKSAVKLVTFLLKSGKLIPINGTDRNRSIPEIKELRSLEVEIPLGEKVILDKLFIVVDKNGDESLLNVEFQTRNDPRMFSRIMLYQTAILKKYGKFASQIVIYIGKDKINMENKKHYNKFGTVIHYEYMIIDMKEIPTGLFLNSDDPELLPFALLTECNDYGMLIRIILNKLRELRGSNIKAFRRDMVNISILSQLRDADKIFKEILQKEGKKLGIEIDIRKNAFFIEGFREGHKKGIQEGLRKGIQEGLRKSTLKLIERRFGPDFRRKIEKLLDKVGDSVNTEKLLDLAIYAESPDEITKFLKNNNSTDK